MTELAAKLAYLFELEKKIETLILNLENYLKFNDLEDAFKTNKRIKEYINTIIQYLKQIKAKLSNNKIKKLLQEEIIISKEILEYLGNMVKKPTKFKNYEKVIKALEASLEKIKKKELLEAKKTQ